MRSLPLPWEAKDPLECLRRVFIKGLVYKGSMAEGGEDKSDLHFEYSDKKLRVFTEFVLHFESPPASRFVNQA